MAAHFRLREALQGAGISQTEAARRSGVSFATVNRMCTNSTTRVDLATLDRLATVVGGEPGDLIVRSTSRKRR